MHRKLFDIHAFMCIQGLGLAAVSNSTEPKLAAVVTKKIALLEGPNTVLSAKLQAESRLDGGDVSLMASHQYEVLVMILAWNS